MATNNIRVVGYLPPSYHEKLREYMQSQSLTESAAIVAIVKQFFDGKSGSDRVANKELDEATAPLKAEMAKLERRLAVLEEAFVSRKQFKPARKAPYQYGTPPVLPPQNITQLARRLGVSAATLEEAAQKDEAEFREWSRRRDPAQRGITVPKRENCTLRLKPISNNRFSDTYFPSPAKDANCQNWLLALNSKHNHQ